MLPNTITVNVGSPAADMVFSDVQKDGNNVSYSAASPQGDLAGMPILRFAAERSGKGIVRSVQQVRIPVYDTDSKQYKEVTANLTLIRPDTVSTAICAKALEIICDAQAVSGVRDAMVSARH